MAVETYQPLIEEKVSGLAGASISLGHIELGNMEDYIRSYAKTSARTGVKTTFKSPVFYMKLGLLSLVFPGIKRQVLSGVYMGIYQQVKSKAEEIKKTRRCSYRNNKIYLSSKNTRLLERTVDSDAVHELTHCLWEVLGGEKVYELTMNESEERRTRAFAEAFAIYGERCWFSDFYPKEVKQRVTNETLNYFHPFIQSFLEIRSLANKYEQKILLKIPKEWKILGEK